MLNRPLNRQQKKYNDYRVRWEILGNQIMWKLIENGPELFSADNYVRLAQDAKFPATFLTKIVPSIFRSYRANGFIEKTKEYITSERQCGILPLYRKRVAPEVTKQGPN